MEYLKQNIILNARNKILIKKFISNNKFFLKYLECDDKKHDYSSLYEFDKYLEECYDYEDSFVDFEHYYETYVDDEAIRKAFLEEYPKVKEKLCKCFNTYLPSGRYEIILYDGNDRFVESKDVYLDKDMKIIFSKHNN